MTTYDNLIQREACHCLVIGDYGTGKSTLAAELAEHGFNLKWISVDGGHKVIGKLPQDARARCDVIVLPDTREYPIGIATARTLFTEWDKGSHSICSMHGTIDCSVCKSKGAEFTTWDFRTLDVTKDIVVLDHLSGVGDSCMNLVTKGKPVDYKLQLDDYGAMKFHLAHLMLAMQNAPFNIIALAHCVEAKLEDGKLKMVPQVGSDATSRTVGKYFDHVIHCDVVNASHKFGSMTSYKASVMTKSRTDVAIEKMETAGLLPFFNGEVAAELKKVDAEKAKKLLTSPAAFGPLTTASSGSSSTFDPMAALAKLTK